MTRSVMAVLAPVLLTLGCATSGTPGDRPEGSTAARLDVISQEELSAHPELTTVADAVRRLRPQWRVETIYVDNRPHMGSSRDIPTAGVRELRYLDISRAQMRWGQSISTPVIHVIRR